MLKNRKKKRLDRVDGMEVAGVYLRKPGNSNADRKAGRKAVADHHEFLRQQALASRGQRRRRFKARRTEMTNRRQQAESNGLGL